MIDKLELKTSTTTQVLHDGVSRQQERMTNHEVAGLFNENNRQTGTQKPDDYASFARWRKQTRENDESRSRWAF